MVKFPGDLVLRVSRDLAREMGCLRRSPSIHYIEQAARSSEGWDSLEGFDRALETFEQEAPNFLVFGGDMGMETSAIFEYEKRIERFSIPAFSATAITSWKTDSQAPTGSVVVHRFINSTV